ncbi:NT-type C2 domain [Dillenia turbinata]|uniref:NT-type C2 domain n=1 Tax=Dillenia turbinata TaxID=194707 RepID=A0AAN8ZS85_9MAGN
MFKSARWRSDKHKIKALFKLQFHATQVPKLGGDGLIISIIPADIGKVTTRLDKAVIKDGMCSWESPIYETVKFNRDPKSGKIHEKIYHFLVSNGLSKAGLLGEVSIDLADYAEATKNSSVALPLKNSNYDAILYVSIQRVQENVDRREVEQIEDEKIKPQDRSLKNQLSNGDSDGSFQSNSTEDGHLKKTTTLNVELNVHDQASSGSDLALSSSESSSGLDTPREIQNVCVNQEPREFLLSSTNGLLLQKTLANGSTTIYQDNQRSPWHWSLTSAHAVTGNSLRDNPQNLEVVIEKLKTELTVLSRQADVSELELQTLRKQIVKETKRGQDLVKEVSSLKEERDSLKEECEKLKVFHRCTEEAKIRSRLQYESGDPQVLLEEIRQELFYEKDLNANLRLQLQKTQESNNELILAVRDLDELLEQKNREMSTLSSKGVACEKTVGPQESISKHKMDYDDDNDEEQKALEEIVKEHSDAKQSYMLEQKVMDLESELEIYRRDKDELEMHMEQLALDYEILKQEHHDMSYKLEQSELQEQLKMQYEWPASYATIGELETQIESLEKELEKQSKEFSESLVTINKLENHVKSLEEELEMQALGFEADLEALTQAKVEQEQKAIRAEETLRKTRWQNASTAEKLQEEFKRLSTQMASTFDANEKLAMKAMTEAGELRLQKCGLEKMLWKAHEELQSARDDYEAKLQELSSQLVSMNSRIDQMGLEIEDKSKLIEHHIKQKEEIHGTYSKESLMLKAEIEKLRADINHLSEHAQHHQNLREEMDQMRTLIEEKETMIQRGHAKQVELERLIASMRKEAEKRLEELNSTNCIKDEESLIGSLPSELETLRAEYNNLKSSSYEDELEKEKLRKQAFQLTSELKKKEDAIHNFEKKLKDHNGRSTVSEGTKMNSRNTKPALNPHETKEVANLREKIKLLEGRIKQKESALETSTNSFLEKEEELQNKIEELEGRVEELSQKSQSFSQCGCHKANKDEGNMYGDGCMCGESSIINAAEQLSSSLGTPSQNGTVISLTKSDTNLSEEELKATTHATLQSKPDELLTEMESLKEQNKAMEDELKEMQERYSEISLKFAEVEGERQKLVMALRNLKNAKKSQQLFLKH